MTSLINTLSYISIVSMASLITIRLPIALVSTPITLPAQDEICVILSGAKFEFPHELVIATRKPAVFYKNGTILVTSPKRNDRDSYFEGTSDEMRRVYCE